MKYTVFKGVTLSEIANADPGCRAVLDAVEFPEVRSWRQLEIGVSPKGQFLWCARPVGKWVAVVRYEDQLVVTDAGVPLDVDWLKLYVMLRTHGAVLYSVLGDQGLVAIAVQQVGEVPSPLAPGFKATVAIDPRKLDAKGLEELSEQGYDWPHGLARPWILHMGTMLPLRTNEHRLDYLGKVPHGLWLVSAAQGKLRIYEVLA